MNARSRSPGGNANKPKNEVICKCNEVRRDVIEAAIRDGARTMGAIYDTTMAGVGSCGGSCRRKLKPLLDHYLEKGTFPDVIVEDPRVKPDSGSGTD